MLVKGIRYARKCSECGRGMNEGYVIGGGCEHYCSDLCLYKHVTHEEFLELYDGGDGDAYYTEWEDQNDWDDDEGKHEMTWTIDGCVSVQNLDIVRSGNRIAMIDCENEALSDSDIMANARLIAAAPDLLAALIELQQMVEAGENNEGTHEIVRNAINKAKGN